MLLKNKTAVIYGGGGAVGGAVARAFAREGATVFLAGRTLSKLQSVANDIIKAGGRAEIALVDALDEQAVEKHLVAISITAGIIDISFNAVSLNDVHGEVLTRMEQDRFVEPVTTAMKTHFITATAAARHMREKGTGVILAITANAGHKPYPDSGGFGVACAAIEAFCRQMAVEEGKWGIRVVCLRSAGSPDAPGVQEALRQHAASIGLTTEAFQTQFAGQTMLKRLPMLNEVANTAVLMASDHASAITAAVVNVTGGELAD